MIEFSKITKTLDGYDCHYFGVRESHGTTLHCFGVWTGYGCCESAYDEQGRRLRWCHEKTCWKVSANQAFQIVKPPKIVEVTRWVGLRIDFNGNYTISTSTDEEHFDNDLFLAKQQHTFRFEVPHD